MKNSVCFQSFQDLLRFGVASLFAFLAAACGSSSPGTPQDMAPGAAGTSLPYFMSTRQYSDLIENDPTLLNQDDAAKFQFILDMGKRNLEWQDYLIQLRLATQTIPQSPQVSHTAGQPSRHPIYAASGISIERPMESNVASIQNSFQAFLKGAPKSMKAILYGAPFAEIGPGEEAAVAHWADILDHTYQQAVRWLGNQEKLPYLIQRRRSDIRGFYYLSRDPQLTEKLAAWYTLPSAERNTLRSWIIGTCINSRDSRTCIAEFETLTRARGPVTLYLSRYWSASQQTYDAYFQIAQRRVDLTWETEGEREVLHVPFVHPQDKKLARYLKENIEDEWHWQNWQLSLDFISPEQMMGPLALIPHLEFQPGVTPYAIMGKGVIVMDKNRPVTDASAQWTIRHEFGHILGFPDCYLEFYDEERATIVNYEIDSDNIMCSRHGRLQPLHYYFLKQIYSPNLRN